MTQATKLTIERTSFFHLPQGGSLQFHEHAGAEPPKHEHHDCNCTKTIDARPAGLAASQIVQSVVFRSERDLGALEVTLQKSVRHWGGLRWTFTWGEGSKEHGGGTGNRPHAYFYATALERSAHVEIVKHVQPWRFDAPNRVPDDSILLSLFMGRAIDTSEFFNGHSPSKVVDLATIGEREVWMHHRIGAENMGRVLDGVEADAWRAAFDDVALIGDRGAQYWNATSTPLAEVCEDVASDVILARAVECVSDWLEGFVKRAPETQVGRWGLNLTEAMEADIQKAMAERASRSVPEA